jgi:hypothetical protein
MHANEGIVKLSPQQLAERQRAIRKSIGPYGDQLSGPQNRHHMSCTGGTCGFKGQLEKMQDERELERGIDCLFQWGSSGPAWFIKPPRSNTSVFNCWSSYGKCAW